ncbi:hypothetical protein G6F46_002746 [Rhizopus delemar]|uniref:Acetyl-CoA synthetase-like protein n=3 Tax=Rhizopus TaxID=4842 RepID=I1CE41_RHIO9|nr:hypothetical protein RO3G_11432 [Rhizopus delemar RA 99-880]KAG1464438.1 hypothetical protein G6F55_001779 [Rhizopus delemar]KAG1549706.1 hypothetical protein G6F51_002898 [Rhizopus arrhizus]KAG1503709.1 hypothetical protein G6F54_001496 [Rhizopus delemar]KAG1516225.1 hypothetical protein G6F53_002320 [Rhizopus delemar]|eukprot:EIE86721.1 hypothetical protein RO3G_11432 [Rhizopus delemar RA 99-880]
MVIFKSNRQSIKIPDIDIYSYLFSPNAFNKSRSQNSPLLIDGITGQTLSYAEVRDLSSRIALGWKERVGLNKGDVEHNVPSRLAEFDHQIRKSNAKVIVTIPSLLPILTAVAERNQIPKDKILLFGNEEVSGFKSYHSIAYNEITYPLSLQDIQPSEDVAFICFSSGTTGLAKGVMLTHKNFVSQIAMVTEFEETDPKQQEVTIGFLPFYHIFGLTTLVIRAFYSLTPVVVLPKYDLELLCQLIEKYKITTAPIVPPVGKVISSGAAPLGSEHIEALNARIKAYVRQGYGMTETTAGCIYQKVGISPLGSTGVLIANMECKLVDEAGNEVNAGQPGEILLKGPTIMKGYLNDDKANKETFTKDGWMRTGDVAKYDPVSGEFFIIDRIKEMIKFKGYQVAPAELEALLMSHPSIADCCVVGVYEASQATELPRAYIVLQPSVHNRQEAVRQIIEFVEGSVANHKRLRGGVRLIDQVPKSPSGKILRRKVKEWIKQEQSEQAYKARL